MLDYSMVYQGSAFKSYKALTVYELIPYTNGLDEIEYDKQYYCEFKNLKELSDSFNLNYSWMSEKASESKKKKITFKFTKHFKGYPKPTSYIVIIDTFTAEELERDDN